MIDVYKATIRYIKEHQVEELNRDFIFNFTYELLRNEFPVDSLRENGIFFTSDEVFYSMMQGESAHKCKIYDPAAGCGDLILRYLDALPVGNSLQETLNEWSDRVYATELNSSFIKLLKLRLLLLASFKHGCIAKLGDINANQAVNFFSGIVCGDALNMRSEIEPELILMNPPYNQIRAMNRYEWCNGKVSLASIFLFEVTRRYPKAQIIAVLPDVLRSGSRYKKFRSVLPFDLEREGRVFGRFDAKTDVDVFTINYFPGLRKTNCQIEGKKAEKTIADYFDVHVGAVVPHRDAKDGVESYYLTARNVPACGRIGTSFERIQSAHNPVKGPFIVIKRTSSPTDKRRCSAVSIESFDLFHIENHLIYLKPRSPGLSQRIRRSICKWLCSSECTDMLNKKIRCRHLTVDVIRDIPMKGVW